MPDPQDPCEGRGWLIMLNTNQAVYEIQRCDHCEKFVSDLAAGMVACEQLMARARR